MDTACALKVPLWCFRTTISPVTNGSVVYPWYTYRVTHFSRSGNWHTSDIFFSISLTVLAQDLRGYKRFSPLLPVERRFNHCTLPSTDLISLSTWYLTVYIFFKNFLCWFPNGLILLTRSVNLPLLVSYILDSRPSLSFRGFFSSNFVRVNESLAALVTTGCRLGQSVFITTINSI